MITLRRSNLLKLFLYSILLYLTHQGFVVLKYLGSFRLRLIIILYSLWASHRVEKISSLEVFDLRTSEESIIIQTLLTLFINYLVRSRSLPTLSLFSVWMGQHRSLLQPGNFFNSFIIIVLLFHPSDYLYLLAFRRFFLLGNIAHTCVPWQLDFLRGKLV